MPRDEIGKIVDLGDEDDEGEPLESVLMLIAAVVVSVLAGVAVGMIYYYTH